MAHVRDVIPDLSVVVPCYNEASCLEPLFSRVASICDQTGQVYELILVNDGSSDETWELICAISEREKQVIGIDLSRNFGQEMAIHAGLSHSRGVLVLVLDADLQDPPELLPQMLSQIRAGADVVYGMRRSRAGETWFKRVTAIFFYWLIGQLSGIKVPKNSGQFRLMRRRVVDVLKQMPERSRFFRGLVPWVGFCQVPILFDREERLAGSSKWPLRKMISLAIDAIVATSIQPLRFSTALACMFLFPAGIIFFQWERKRVRSRIGKIGNIVSKKAPDPFSWPLDAAWTFGLKCGFSQSQPRPEWSPIMPHQDDDNLCTPLQDLKSLLELLPADQLHDQPRHENASINAMVVAVTAIVTFGWTKKDALSLSTEAEAVASPARKL